MLARDASFITNKNSRCTATLRCRFANFSADRRIRVAGDDDDDSVYDTFIVRVKYKSNTLDVVGRPVREVIG